MSLVLSVTCAVLYWNYYETLHRRMSKKQGVILDHWGKGAPTDHEKEMLRKAKMADAVLLDSLFGPSAADVAAVEVEEDNQQQHRKRKRRRKRRKKKGKDNHFDNDNQGDEEEEAESKLRSKKRRKDKQKLKTVEQEEEEEEKGFPEGFFRSVDGETGKYIYDVRNSQPLLLLLDEAQP